MAVALLAAAALAPAPGGAAAQDQTPAPESVQGSSNAELAHQLANPVSSLISVPFQLNYDCCTGLDDDGRYTLNVQPVLPIALSSDWNLIVRTILPIVHQEGFDDRTGLGDTTQSFFFSPKSEGGLIWAVGPALFYPTGTEGFSGAKWGAGPTVLVLKQQSGGGSTYGVLANHIWSFAGAEHRSDISSTFIQPFFNHTWPDSTSFVLNSESTYDWEREEWSIPINVGVTHLYSWGGQRVQLGLFGRAYAQAPRDEPDWGLRFVTTLLFPTG